MNNSVAVKYLCRYFCLDPTNNPTALNNIFLTCFPVNKLQCWLGNYRLIPFSPSLSLSQPLSHCWIIPHTIAPVVHALPTLSARFPSQIFAANMLVLCFVVVSHPTKEIHLKNSSMSPEIHDSNRAQLVLISSLIEPHIKVILLQLHSLSAPLYSDTQAQSSKR